MYISLTTGQVGMEITCQLKIEGQCCVSPSSVLPHCQWEHLCQPFSSHKLVSCSLPLPSSFCLCMLFLNQISFNLILPPNTCLTCFSLLMADTCPKYFFFFLLLIYIFFTCPRYLWILYLDQFQSLLDSRPAPVTHVSSFSLQSALFSSPIS